MCHAWIKATETSNTSRDLVTGTGKQIYLLSPGHRNNFSHVALVLRNEQLYVIYVTLNLILM